VDEDYGEAFALFLVVDAGAVNFDGWHDDSVFSTNFAIEEATDSTGCG
jgi:hypothetical protein